MECIGDFDDLRSAIAAKIMSQQTPITGAAHQKADVRAEFEDKILMIADQIAALGFATHNMQLANQAELTLSTLDKMADDALEETGQRIADLATTNIAALADYDIDGEDVTALTTLKTQFHNIKTAPRTAAAGRAGETKTLPDLIAQTRSLLRNRLDKLMTRFKTSDPTFYAAYRSARVIVDRGAPQRPQATPATQPQ